MSSCLVCDVPLPDDDSLCWTCFRRVIVPIAWPQVRRVLEAQWSKEEFVAVKHAIAQTLRERDSNCKIDVSPQRALAREVTYAETQGRELRARMIALIQAVSGLRVHDAFASLLLIVILQRLRYRRQLRKWFGVDIERGRVLPKNPFPLLPIQQDLFDRTVQSYWQNAAALSTCLVAILTAQQEGRRLDEIAEAGVQAMVPILTDIERSFMPFLDAPNLVSQERAAIVLAGFMRPHLRLYASLRRVLGEAGDPRTVLKEMLPGFIVEAYRSGTKDTGALVRQVGRLLDHTRRTGRKKAQRNAPEQVLENLEARRTRKQDVPNELEEWYAKETALLDDLIQRAGLSPREAEVWSLQRAGFSQAATALGLKISEGSVRQYRNRIKKKVREAAQS